MTDLPKLTKAQRALYDDLPTSCHEGYPPAKRLVELGLARWIPSKYGASRLVRVDGDQS